MKRNISVPMALTGLVIAFVFISFLIYITKGKKISLIRTKLKLGALILSLTSAVSTGVWCEQGELQCYQQPIRFNMISINNISSSNTIPVNLSAQQKIISGTITHRQGSNFSYCIIDIQGNQIISSGNISAADGSFDETTEQFNIDLENWNRTGNFLLKIYNNSINNINKTNNSNLIAQYNLIIQ